VIRRKVEVEFAKKSYNQSLKNLLKAESAAKIAKDKAVEHSTKAPR